MAECRDTQKDQVHGRVHSFASGEEVCEPCEVDNIILPAVGWCETCDELLCNGCYEHHCRPRTMRNHRLMYIADKKNMKQRKRVSMKCEKHEGKPLEYFCEDHAELGCTPCFVTKHRSCSNVVYIADVKTKESKEFKTLETLWTQFETRLKRNENIIEDNLCRTERSHDKAIADIKDAGNKLTAQIDVLVKRQISKANAWHEENIKRMGSVQEMKADIAKKLKSGREMIAAVITDNNRLFLTMKSLQDEAPILRSMLDESVKKNKVKEYEFELSSESSDVLEKVHHIGTLKATTLLNLEKVTDEVVDLVEMRRFQQSHAKNTFFSFSFRDEISVSTDHDIRPLDVLVYACHTTDRLLNTCISERGNSLIRCISIPERKYGQQVMPVNVVKSGGARGITLEAGHQYVIGVC